MSSRHWRLRPYTATTRLHGVEQPRFWGIDHARAKKACKALRKKAAARVATPELVVRRAPNLSAALGWNGA